MFFSGKNMHYIRFLALLPDIEDKTICIDIDNTLADANSELERRGYNLSQYPHPQLNDSFWKMELGRRILNEAKPIKNTIRIVQTLINMNVNIIFATQRPIELTGLTYEWMKRHITPLWGKDSVFFTKNKTSLNADIYFEDNPHEILEMLKCGKVVLAPVWPYNSMFEAPRMIYYSINRNEKEKEGGYAVAGNQ